MKFLQFSYLVLLVDMLFSCISNPRNSELIKPKYKTEICSLDTINKYQIYVPAHPNNCSLLPLVLVIDPHGLGKQEIERFVNASNKYQFVVVASNLIKNNYPGFNSAIETLLTDVLLKYQLKGPVFIAGFSGGARMALSYSGSVTISGILACGALASKEQLVHTNVPIYSLLGMADFNFPEVAQYILSPNSAPSNLFIEISDLEHEWPSSKDLERSLGFMILSCPANMKGCLDTKRMMENYEFEISNYLDSLKLNNEYIRASLITKNLMNLAGLKNKRDIKSKFDILKNNLTYTDEIQQLKKSLQFEMKVRDAYFNALISKDKKWWKNEIVTLDNQIKNEHNKYSLFAYKRIRSYLGILCYSECRNYLQSNVLNEASKVLEIYKILEPKNPDMLYYSALFEIKSGHIEESVKLLKDCLNAGLIDKSLISQTFPKSISERVLGK
jgi:hypothetical protein